MEAEVAIEADCALGEGPVWVAERQTLYWVDIDERRIHWHTPADGEGGAFDTPERPGAVVPAAGGGLVLAAETRFWSCGPRGEDWRQLASIPHPRAGMRMNDGKCDRHGRFWAGSVAEAFGPEGTLYRLDPDGGVSAHVDGLCCSNGLDWTADDRRFYLTDSVPQRIDVFDLDAATGTLSNRRPLIQFESGDGLPDGLTLDEQGQLWSAFWDGGCVRRISPDGEVTEELRLPVSRPTSCAFGGADGRDLYVTSARTGLGDEQLAREPLAGSVFRLRPGVRGEPARPFGAG